jgi:hypothetical protein
MQAVSAKSTKKPRVDATPASDSGQPKKKKQPASQAGLGADELDRARTRGPLRNPNSEPPFGH